MSYSSPYSDQYPGPSGLPPAVPTTSGRAVAALVTGIVSVLLCGLFTGIPAIVLGIMANRDIKRSGGRVGGSGLAIAGIVTGILGTLISVAFATIFVVALVVGHHVTENCYTDATGAAHCTNG